MLLRVFLSATLLLSSLVAAVPVANRADSLPTQGGRLHVYGTGFLDLPIVRVRVGTGTNPDECTNVRVHSDTMYTCSLPEGTGRSKVVRTTFVRRDAQERTNTCNGCFSYLPPSIRELEYNEADNLMRITGVNFGTTPLSSTVRLVIPNATEPNDLLVDIQCAATSTPAFTPHTQFYCTPGNSFVDFPDPTTGIGGQFHVRINLNQQNSDYVNEPTVTRGLCYPTAAMGQLRTDSILFERSYRKVLRRTTSLLATLRSVRDRLPRYAVADSCCESSFLYGLDLNTVAVQAMQAMRFGDCLDSFCEDVDEFGMITAGNALLGK